MLQLPTILPLNHHLVRMSLWISAGRQQSSECGSELATTHERPDLNDISCSRVSNWSSQLMGIALFFVCYLYVEDTSLLATWNRSFSSEIYAQ